MDAVEQAFHASSAHVLGCGDCYLDETELPNEILIQVVPQPGDLCPEGQALYDRWVALDDAEFWSHDVESHLIVPTPASPS